MSAVPVPPVPEASLCHSQTVFAPYVEMIEKEFGKDVHMKNPVSLPAQSTTYAKGNLGFWQVIVPKLSCHEAF